MGEEGRNYKPWRGDRNARRLFPRAHFCRPSGAGPFYRALAPRLTPWATFCRPSGAFPPCRCFPTVDTVGYIIPPLRGFLTALLRTSYLVPHTSVRVRSVRRDSA